MQDVRDRNARFQVVRRAAHCIVMLLTVTACAAPSTIQLRQKLTEEERMLATAALSTFDVTKPGKVHIEIDGETASHRLLRYVNGISPKLKFTTRSPHEIFAWSISLARPEFFYPDYAYVHVTYTSLFNGRGDGFGHVMHRSGEDWVEVDIFRMDVLETLDLKAYVKNKIEAAQTPE